MQKFSHRPWNVTLFQGTPIVGTSYFTFYSSHNMPPIPRPTLVVPAINADDTAWLEEATVDYDEPRDAGLQEDRDLQDESKCKRPRLKYNV